MRRLLEEYRESRRLLLQRIAQLSAQEPPQALRDVHALSRRIRTLREEVSDLNWVMDQISRYLGRR